VTTAPFRRHSFIREETLAKLPEEQLLASTRVLRDAHHPVLFA
jgi:hypothetical protein